MPCVRQKSVARPAMSAGSFSAASKARLRPAPVSSEALIAEVLEHRRRTFGADEIARAQTGVDGTEIVADATLSHATDWYLPEHVFEGTPMFPGVMAIEAMPRIAANAITFAAVTSPFGSGRFSAAHVAFPIASP